MTRSSAGASHLARPVHLPTQHQAPALATPSIQRPAALSIKESDPAEPTCLRKPLVSLRPDTVSLPYEKAGPPSSVVVSGTPNRDQQADDVSLTESAPTVQPPSGEDGGAPLLSTQNPVAQMVILAILAGDERELDLVSLAETAAYCDVRIEPREGK